MKFFNTFFLLSLLILGCCATTGSATTVTDTIILNPEEIESEPFGLTSLPDTLYAYFSYDDSLLSSDGDYSNLLQGFEFAVGDAIWAHGDILDNLIRVKNGTVTDVFIDLSPIGDASSNRWLSIEDFDEDEGRNYWLAIDASGRPTPTLSGNYTIAAGYIAPVAANVPEPSSILIFGLGLAGLYGVSRRRGN